MKTIKPLIMNISQSKDITCKLSALLEMLERIEKNIKDNQRKVSNYDLYRWDSAIRLFTEKSDFESEVIRYQGIYARVYRYYQKQIINLIISNN
jgi:hypothetical protein